MIMNTRQIGILFAAMTAFMLITFFASPSHARSRHHHHFHRHHVAHHHHARHRHHARHHHIRHHRHAHRSFDANGNSVSIVGLVAPLQAKVRQIIEDCGSKVVSAFRPGARIAGTHHLSNHALHRAADLRGNPHCIYNHLAGWPGGYSTDYASAPGGPHVHISYNPNKEWGLRFAHHHFGTHTLHARSRHHRHLYRRAYRHRHHYARG